MKTLVVFDSMYGNTEKIARAMAAALSGELVVKRAAEAGAADLENIDLLIIGSPTQGGRPLKAMLAFLDKLTESNLKGLKTGVFDTRLPNKWVKVFGYAGGKIADTLRNKGALMPLKEEGFFVNKAKGDALLDGELERAAEWAKKISCL